MAMPQGAAFRGYTRTQSARPLREMEAEVFTIAAGRLRHAAQQGSDFDRIRARADARRLFSVLQALILHPSSELPPALRATIASVCAAALREADAPEGDLDFLCAVCEDFAAGLSAQAATVAA